jgi:hypothetical protein
VIDVEPVIRSELDRLFPEPSDRRASWADVTSRASVSDRWFGDRRRLALAVAAAVAVVLSAAAVAARLGGFDAWLRGAPGEPAPRSEQRRFEAENARSWLGFPRGTELRELIRTNAGGQELVLYGFRAGQSLCLRLEARGIGRREQSCVPALVAARSASPVVVATVDGLFVDRANRPRVQFSFGIAADGVQKVVVAAVDGEHRARLGGNAYLWVQEDPNTANSVLRTTAISAAGKRYVMRTWRPRAPMLRAGAEPPGPRTIEAPITNPRVGWYERGEKRGVSSDHIKLTPEQAVRIAGARLVKPDPLSDVVVGIEGHYCQISIYGSTGFWAKGCADELFPQGGALKVMSTGAGGEFYVVQGIAADGIARIVVFGSDGQRQAAPIKHNMFATLVGIQQFPIRIVGYDANGQVAAIETPPFFGREPVPRAAQRLRPALRVAAEGGATATLLVGPTVRYTQCWRIDFRPRLTRADCDLLPSSGPKIDVMLVQPVGKDMFVFGRVTEPVVRVDFELPLRERVLSTRPVQGRFLIAIPRRYLSERRQHGFVVAFDARGHRAQRQGIYFKLRRGG